MSHIVVMATVVLVSFSILVALLQVHAVHSHKGSHGLSCINDFVNNVSCTWGGSPVAPGVDCWVSGVKTTWILQNNRRQRGTLLRSCRLKQHRNSPPGCSFVFENEEFNPFKSMPFIRMECNGTLVENLTNYRPYNHIKMHPPGVPNVSSTANETRISWSPGSRPSDFFKSFHFQAQIKQKNKMWNTTRTLSTQEPELLIPAGKLKGLCQVRVRVKPTEQLHSSLWSDWSPAASWMEGRNITTSQDQEWLLGHISPVKCAVMLTVGLIIVALVLYGSCARRGFRLLKVKSKPVPNPSRYFHTLHSVHGGNLKKWINPSSVSESFFTAQPSDIISPVEVCESWDVVSSTSPSTSALLHFRSCPSAGSDTNGIADNSSSSSSSCFSNMGYFMSSSSRSSARTDPNPVYFTYQDDFHNLRSSYNLHLSLCPPLNTSVTYESLKREPQSPDSGFGIGKEDEEAKDDKRVTDVEKDEVCGDPLLILPLYIPAQMCPPSSAPPPPDAPSLSLTSSNSQQVDVPVAAASGSYAAWPMAGAMCRSSSMHEETCKTGYLTLKELQTTFSNKSI